MKTLAAAAGIACLFAITTPVLAASPPKFTASCSKGVDVTSNGKGNVRVNGQKATVKPVSATAWKARTKSATVDIGRDGATVYVSNGADVCEVTSSSAAPNKDGSMGGVPAKDQQACLAAVSNKANSGEVVVLAAQSSEANNELTIGVGPDKARWQCLVKHGHVSQVMSLTNEGAL